MIKKILILAFIIIGQQTIAQSNEQLPADIKNKKETKEVKLTSADKENHNETNLNTSNTPEKTNFFSKDLSESSSNIDDQNAKMEGKDVKNEGKRSKLALFFIKVSKSFKTYCDRNNVSEKKILDLIRDFL